MSVKKVDKAKIELKIDECAAYANQEIPNILKKSACKTSRTSPLINQKSLNGKDPFKISYPELKVEKLSTGNTPI